MAGPYLIAEACHPHSAKAYHRPGTRDGKFHLLPAERATRTYCNREVANRTMIPLDEWGAAGAVWCGRCQHHRAAAGGLLASHSPCAEERTLAAIAID